MRLWAGRLALSLEVGALVLVEARAWGAHAARRGGPCRGRRNGLGGGRGPFLQIHGFRVLGFCMSRTLQDPAAATEERSAKRSRILPQESPVCSSCTYGVGACAGYVTGSLWPRLPLPHLGLQGSLSCEQALCTWAKLRVGSGLGHFTSGSQLALGRAQRLQQPRTAPPALPSTR